MGITRTSQRTPGQGHDVMSYGKLILSQYPNKSLIPNIAFRLGCDIMYSRESTSSVFTLLMLFGG